MGEYLSKNFHHEAYEKESWFKKVNYTAHRAVQNASKYFSGGMDLS